MSGRLGALGRELLAGWPLAAGEAVEIFEKRGRSRSFALASEGENFTQSVEAGWAVRGGDAQRSWFVAGSGTLPRALERPSATAPGLWLPPVSERRAAPPAPGVEPPLATEAEGRALLAGVARELLRELPDAAPPRLRLEEGASESAVLSSRGVVASWRARSAALRVEARRGDVGVAAEFGAGAAAELKPLALARRLVDRLLALDGALPVPAPELFVLAPPVAARLLAAWAPRLVGVEARERLARLLDGDRRLASPVVSVIDDGSLASGLLPVPFDGEGVPCGAVTLVDAGRFVRPLLGGRDVEPPERAAGCARRDGWRDVPRTAPTQLYLAPDANRSVADLVAEIARGAYLIATEGGVELDGDGGFSVAVSGFALAGGRGAGGLGSCRLTGSLRDLLRGVRAVARDLTFVPGDGCFGAPTVLASGLALVPGAGYAG